MFESEAFVIEDHVLIGMNGKSTTCYADYLKHDYIIPEDVVAIKGKDFVPFAMNKFQITTNVKKIDWKAFGKCVCIKKFIVVDAETNSTFVLSKNTLKPTPVIPFVLLSSL